MESIQKTLEIKLTLYANPKLLSYFENDPHSDITIILQSHHFKLQKAYLRLDSTFFNTKCDDSDNSIIIERKFNSKLFEKILKLFYGSQQIITEPDIYQVYDICNYLGIEQLIIQLQEELSNNFRVLNFFMVYALAFNFSVKNLMDICEEYLIEKQFKIIQVKSMMSLNNNGSKMPSSLVDLNEQAFSNLLKIHNKQAQEYLKPQEIYNVIKCYWECKQENTQLAQTKINEFVQQFFDKNKLQSADYESIIHKTIIANDSFIPDTNNDLNYQTFTSTMFTGSDKKQSMELLASENFLYKKQIQEVKEQNEIKLTQLKVPFNNNNKILNSQNSTTQAIKSFSQLIDEQKSSITAFSHQIKNTQQMTESKLKALEAQLSFLHCQLDQKGQELDSKTTQICQLKQEIDTLKYSHNQYSSQQQQEEIANSLTPEKNQEDIKYYEEQQLFDHNTTIESCYYFGAQQQQFQQQQQQQSQLQQQIKNPDTTPYQNSDILTISTHQMVIELLRTSIYQTLRLQKLYSGTDNGFTIQGISKALEGQAPVLFLIKTWDSEKIFAGYTEIPCTWQTQQRIHDPNACILSLNQGKKFKSVGKMEEIVQGKDCMVNFAGGFLIADKCDKHKISLCSFPDNYEFDGKGSEGARYLAGEKYFQVYDIEAFLVEIDSAMDF